VAYFFISKTVYSKRYRTVEKYLKKQKDKIW